MNVTNQDFDEFVDNLDYADLLQRTVTRYARVVIICASGDAVRKLMLAAHRLGMTDGSYAFFNIVLFDSSYFGDTGWARGDGDDEEAKAAYRALMTFTLHKNKSEVFDDFALHVKDLAKSEFNFSYDEINEEVRTMAGYSYNAFF
ncbi:atrial natriuretic peptide receptor 3-like [Lytechinus pictus]|uniref:atrial natriuretic peptide receptor 3-like n=1 Tax=Lytechinus pictus TaxID=7653 RepID=UPI0030B9F173